MFLRGSFINLITIKINDGCGDFFKLLLKITSCACLLMSRLFLNVMMPSIELWIDCHLILLRKHLC